MLIAVYHCNSADAVKELMGELDPRESMDVSFITETAWLAVYKSAYLVAVATDTSDMPGVTLLFQHYERRD